MGSRRGKRAGPRTWAVLFGPLFLTRVIYILISIGLKPRKS